MSKVRFENISKVYENGFKAVENFNLEINDKEFLILVGPSGCGKSTLLRIIAGLEDISSGELYIDDVKVNELESKDRDISMVFQNYALYPHKNVYDNLSFGLKIRNENKKVIDEKVKEVSKILNLEELLKRKPSELSGGQRQRVALGRAIIRNPKVFLMDEPLSNLDAKLRTNMRSEIIKLQRNLETTTIYVTHDQTEAMTMGDRIVVMDKGIIQQVGTPDELYRSPKNIFVAEFIGMPSINILKKDFYNKYLNGNIEKNILVGIRPENIEILDGENFKISIVENLGSEKIIYLENQELNVIVKVTDFKNYIVGEKVSIKIKDEKLLNYFDETTENSVFL